MRYFALILFITLATASPAFSQAIQEPGQTAGMQADGTMGGVNIATFLSLISWLTLVTCSIVLCACVVGLRQGIAIMRSLDEEPTSVVKARAMLAETTKNTERAEHDQRRKQALWDLRDDASPHPLAKIWQDYLSTDSRLDPSLVLSRTLLFCGADVTRLLQWVAKVSIMAGMFGTIVGLTQVFSALDGTTPDMSGLTQGFRTALFTTLFGVPISVAAFSVNKLVWSAWITRIREMTETATAEVVSLLSDAEENMTYKEDQDAKERRRKQLIKYQQDIARRDKARASCESNGVTTEKQVQSALPHYTDARTSTDTSQSVETDEPRQQPLEDQANNGKRCDKSAGQNDIYDDETQLEHAHDGMIAKRMKASTRDRHRSTTASQSKTGGTVARHDEHNPPSPETLALPYSEDQLIDVRDDADYDDFSRDISEARLQEMDYRARNGG